MIPKKRQDEILELVQEKQYCEYSFLAKKLFVSVATVRRDAQEMESRGLIRIVKNGISTINEPKDLAADYSRTVNLDKKKQLSKYAGNIITNGMSLFIDSSSTCLVFMREISAIDNLYIVTNGIVEAQECFHHPNWHVSLIGGEINKTLQNIGGPKGIQDISNYHADLSIFSCRGLIDQGASDANEDEAFLKRAFVNNSDKSLLLVDSTKIHKHNLYLGAQMSDLDYIATDMPLPADLALEANKNNVLLLN